MLIDLSVQQLLEVVASDRPVPGGGSVSALTGAFGANLAIMYANLSFNKPYYQALNEAIKQSFHMAHAELQEVSKQLQLLVDEDANAYQQVMDAYRLPKATTEEQEYRKQQIALANAKAIDAPYQTMKIALKGLTQLDKLLPYGNPNAKSDLGVAAILLDSALQGAKLNVLINLTSDLDPLLVEVNKLAVNSQELKQQIIQQLNTN